METRLSLSSPVREAFRLRAWELHQQGWKQQAIAEALGVNQASVSRWIARAEEGGTEALRPHRSSGAPRRLTSEQRAELPDLLKHGAEAFGFRGEVWTRSRVAEVIDKRFGVRYSLSQIGRLLKEIEWSRKIPQRRPRQRNEEEIEAFKSERWPRIKKRGFGKVERSFLSMKRGFICCRWRYAPMLP